MQTGRILKTGLAVGVVANLYAYVTNTFLFPKLFSAPAFLNDMASTPLYWFVIGDFVAAFVLVWFFDKVRGSFGAGAAGGAAYGLSIGIVMNFPRWIMMHVVIRDFSYATAWTWTVTGILWAVIMGAVAGAVWDKAGGAEAKAAG